MTEVLIEGGKFCLFSDGKLLGSCDVTPAEALASMRLLQICTNMDATTTGDWENGVRITSAGISLICGRRVGTMSELRLRSYMNSLQGKAVESVDMLEPAGQIRLKTWNFLTGLQLLFSAGHFWDLPIPLGDLRDVLSLGTTYEGASGDFFIEMGWDEKGSEIVVIEIISREGIEQVKILAEDMRSLVGAEI